MALYNRHVISNKARKAEFILWAQNQKKLHRLASELVQPGGGGIHPRIYAIGKWADQAEDFYSWIKHWN